jgi:hypothetical protein
MSGTVGADRQRYRRAILFDGVMALIILLAWWPFLQYLMASA